MLACNQQKAVFYVAIGICLLIGCGSAKPELKNETATLKAQSPAPVPADSSTSNATSSNDDIDLFLSGLVERPAFSKQMIQRIRDDLRPCLQEGYSDLFFHVMFEPEGLAGPHGMSVPYADLIDRPKKFRGDPVTIEGVLWRLYQWPNRELVTFDNDTNEPISPYEAWIVDGDARPYRVVAAKLPPNLKPGESLHSVRLTGHFVAIENHELPHAKEFDVDFKTVAVPMLFAKTIDPVTKTAVSELNVKFVKGQKTQEPELPPIKVRLRSDSKGKMTELTCMDESFGRGRTAFEQLNRRIRTIIGRPGNPLMKDIVAEIDADAGISYSDVSKAAEACVGYGMRCVEDVRFEVPHKPGIHSK